MFLIGTDIGTSSTKTVITAQDGRIISSDVQQYGVLEPNPSWAEQYPDVWLDAVKRSIHNAVEKGKIEPAQAACMGEAGCRWTDIWRRSVLASYGWTAGARRSVRD